MTYRPRIHSWPPMPATSDAPVAGPLRGVVIKISEEEVRTLAATFLLVDTSYPGDTGWHKQGRAWKFAREHHGVNPNFWPGKLRMLYLDLVDPVNPHLDHHNTRTQLTDDRDE